MEALLLLNCGSRDQISAEVDELPMGCEKLSQFLLIFICLALNVIAFASLISDFLEPQLSSIMCLTHVKCWIFLDFNLKYKKLQALEIVQRQNFMRKMICNLTAERNALCREQSR